MAESVNPGAVAKRTVVDTLTTDKERLLAMLPEVASGPKVRERLFALAVAATKDPKLANCTPGSIVSAVVKSIQAGLPIDGIHAAIVPQKTKGVLNAEFRAMYQGLVAAGRRSKEVRQVWAECVYEGETFDVQLGSDPKLVHVPRWDLVRTPHTLTHAYACMRWAADERVEFIVLTKQQIEETKARAPAKESGPWSKDEDYPEMAKKTAIRRLSKRMPLDPDAARIFKEDEEQDLGPIRTPEYEVQPIQNEPKLSTIARARREAKAKAKEPVSASVDPGASQGPQEASPVASGDPDSDDPFAGWQEAHGNDEDPG